MKRFWSILIALSLMLMLSVVLQPVEKAEAVTGWPLETKNTRALRVIAHSEDRFTLLECNASSGRPVMRQYQNGQFTSTLPLAGGHGCMLNTNHHTGDVTKDGALYVVEYSNDIPYLVSQKNGRQLWRLNISHPNDCASWQSGKQSGEMTVESMSIGADGLLYSLVKPYTHASQLSCYQRLIAVDVETGSLQKDIQLAAGPAEGTGIYPGPSKLWTYEDKILVMDRSSTVRIFDYDGVEDVSQRYTLPVPANMGINQVVADQDGNIFAATRRVWTNTGTAPLLYRLADGTTGSIGDTSNYPYILPDGNGGVDALNVANASVDHYDTATDTFTQGTTLTAPAVLGYSTAELSSYAKDDQGNLLISWVYQNGDDVAYRLALYDTSNTMTILEGGGKEPGNSSTTSVYLMTSLPIDLGLGVVDGSLYAPSCIGASVAQCWNAATPTTWVQKIPIEGFGEPIIERNGYAEYMSQKLEYVALGDSFSSGEGVEPFTYGTAVDGTNECHRSEGAYPMLLEEDSSLNLNLTAFVACSGATTSNVLNGGQWGEPAQINALSESTDVATISIGGNDMGFTEFATSCVLAACDEYSTAYSTAVANINNLDSALEETYESILEDISEDGQLYVVNYPMMVPMDKTTIDPIDYDCHYLWGGTHVQDVNTNPWGNGRAVQDVIARLNAKIESVVYDLQAEDARIHYVDVSSAFEGHDLCSSDTYFTNNYLLPGVFHPNGEGIEVLKEVVGLAIAE